MIYRAVFGSDAQQSDSVIHIYILFHIRFHYGLLQDIESGLLCSTVGPCCFSILCIAVCTCQPQTLNASLPYNPCLLGNHSLFSMSVSLFLFQDVFIFYLFACLFIYILAAPRGLRAFNSPRRNRTRASAVKAPSPKHWTTRQVPSVL